MSILKLIFGDPNKKTLKSIQPIIEKINSLEVKLASLSDDELRNKTGEFRDRLSKGETLDDILPEAFATVREASKRVLGMRHYDVQLIGGVVLHRGGIAEMRTGEGKTLVATLPIYLNALSSKGVHLVTANDYLAKRDAVWMGKLYNYLGLTIGIVQNLRVSYMYDASMRAEEAAKNSDEEKEIGVQDETGAFLVKEDYLRPCSRQETYRADITYGTNNEFGFDYLRDNMVQNLSDMVMRPESPMNFAIVDEVDSILIDEARTPLIISAPAEEAADKYYQFAKLVRNLKEGEDYNVDEKMRAVSLTEAGIAKFEKWLNIENIYAEGGINTIHHIEQALKAEVLFKLDRDYIVDKGEVVIIDEFTGRKMPGRRYSEGLHQAIEAKENVKIQKESRTLATITFQNLFRMYGKLSGMTGTAVTEAEEFGKIYNLDVVTVPTNRADLRKDHPDRIYRTEETKIKALVEKVKECQKKKQPVLIGTISVEKNEELSMYLTQAGVQHEILNAKNHEREGEIISQAGKPGAVTLATNMAGRGVDIKLGGSPADPNDLKTVLAAGGLFVIGTERHEARRIDNQLRGRAARQGDPGETQFFISTDDDLMRIFAGDRIKSIMTRLNVPDDMPIENSMISKVIEGAQKKVEGFHFDTRKHLLEYDDVLNRHRHAVYGKRRRILELAAGVNYGEEKLEENTEENGEKKVVEKSLREIILGMIEKEIELVVSFHTNSVDRKEWNLKEIFETMRTILNFSDEEKNELFAMGNSAESKLDEVKAREKLVAFLSGLAQHSYEETSSRIVAEHGDNVMRDLAKSVLINAIDSLWVDHLVMIDYLRTGIGLQGYGQRDPLVEYKKETYYMFNNLMVNIQKETVYSFFKIAEGLRIAPSIMADDKMVLRGAEKNSTPAPVVRTASGEKVGRNDPCPCGSGKKFKKCHGK
ncbi:MAG TPA: preprotein translocase subunit SecA [Candidatus Magasanikbacteria bacterium]|nr:preprotein translocase subunit SecA [Candidatus Magasanikbacteria bacterium]